MAWAAASEMAADEATAVHVGVKAAVRRRMGRAGLSELVNTTMAPAAAGRDGGGLRLLFRGFSRRGNDEFRMDKHRDATHPAHLHGLLYRYQLPSWRVVSTSATWNAGRMSSSSEDEADDPTPNAALLRLLAGGAGTADDDESDDEQDPPAASNAAPASSTSAAAASKAASGQSELLPSATSVLFDGGGPKPDFLRVSGPEFDASANFKPPPVTHSELTGINLDPYRPLKPRKPDEEAPEQRYHQEDDSTERTRVRGSVCAETDDERGRRVMYGAHSMLRADPWSACNPNKKLRSHASGKKRPAGQY